MLNRASELDGFFGRPRQRRMDMGFEWILEKQVGRVWIGYIWLRIGNTGELL
jgi:hypothetical protein